MREKLTSEHVELASRFLAGIVLMGLRISQESVCVCVCAYVCIHAHVTFSLFIKPSEFNQWSHPFHPNDII